MLLVTGANGVFGRSVVGSLLGRGAADLAVSVRDPERAGDLRAQGVEVRTADFDDPDGLALAFAGAEAVLVNGTNYGTAVAGGSAAQLTAAIRAAARAGVQRLVVTSWQDLDHCDLGFTGQFHEVEDELARAFGRAGTSLRMTWGMAASVARDVSDARSRGVLRAPAASATIAPAAVSDLAEAAAVTLAEPKHTGRTYELTGPDCIDWSDLAVLAGDLSGRAISYEPVSEQQFRTQLSESGFPVEAIDMLLDYYAAFRAGWGSHVHDDLGDLLGRSPTSSLEAVREVVSPPAA